MDHVNLKTLPTSHQSLNQITNLKPYVMTKFYWYHKLSAFPSDDNPFQMQAVFRGYQVRKQHTKLVWSVGILEKAILRWRLKRKGLRGLQVQCCEPPIDSNEEGNAEEDFFRAGRKQAEERVERSVVKVQAMFGSKQAQEGYRRMKLEHSKAKVFMNLSQLFISFASFLYFNLFSHLFCFVW